MVTKEEALELPELTCPTVTLQDRLLDSLEEVATMRAKREDDMSVNKFIDVQRHHFVGLCGEAAVAGFYSIPMNLSYEHPIDPGYDFIARYTPNNERFTIDVKTRTKHTADLLVSKDNATKNVDVYIFCVKQNNAIGLFGAAKRKMVENAETTEVNNETVYRVSQDELYAVARQDYVEAVNLNMEGLSSVDVDKEHLLTVKNI